MAPLNAVGELVHGVGADQQALGAGGLQVAADVGEHGAGLVPGVGLLQADDAGEIDGPHHDVGRMQPAETDAHLLVDASVVHRGAFPAHAADQADHLHSIAPVCPCKLGLCQR